MSEGPDYAVREPTNALLALRDDLRFTPESSGTKRYYLIEDPLRGKFYRVGLPEITFISLLDGQTSVARALGVAASQLGAAALSEQEALSICRWLVDCQLASTRQSASVPRLLARHAQNDRRQVQNRLNPLMIKVPLVNPDRLLAAAAPWLCWLFSWPFVLVWTVLCGYSLSVVWRNWSHFSLAPTLILDRSHWLHLAAVWLALKLLHEAFHGLACKRYGGTVRSAGAMFILLTPVAFVDVNSAWRFRSKWQRAATAAAGVYGELLVAALAVVVWDHTAQVWLRCLCYDVAIMAGLQTLLFNANPLVRWDGYFILSDLCEIPNLHSCGQQYLGFLCQRRLLGWDCALPDWPRSKAWLIKIYAVAALAWRLLIILTLAAALIGLYSYLGGLLVTVLLIFWYVVPGVPMLRQFIRQGAGQTVHKARLIFVGAILTSVLLLAAVVLDRPGLVVAPAAVEYSPLTIIRAESPGFVREICVHEGDLLQPQQVVVRLANDELQYAAADLERAWEQSVIQGRAYFRQGDFTKYQIELANQASLRKRQTEAQSQVAALNVRTPVAGRVVARNLATLAGQYLPQGAEIAIVGDEAAKELVVAIAQENARPFLVQLGKPVAFRIRGTAGKSAKARFTKLAPRASLELPHPALGAHVGGPVAVRMKAISADAAGRPEQPYELLAPRFSGTVLLTPAQSVALRSGQLGMVEFRTASESTGTGLAKAFSQWLQWQGTQHPL